MNKAELELLLAGGVVHFRYKKKEGETRTAFGTRSENLIPPKQTDKGPAMETLIKELKPLFMSPVIVKNLEAEKILHYHNVMDELTGFERAGKERNYTPNPDSVNYYDFEAKGWRSFKMENFLEVVK